MTLFVRRVLAFTVLCALVGVAMTLPVADYAGLGRALALSPLAGFAMALVFSLGDRLCVPSE